MTRNLVMTFLNVEGRKTNITLNNVRPDLTAEEINGAMDIVIAKNIFETKGGDLVSKNSAKIVDRTTKDIQLS